MIFLKSNKNTNLYNPEKHLSELANNLETDKGTADKSSLSWGPSHPQHHCWHYTTTYERYMDTKRGDSINLLEVGICDGRFPFASPKMWAAYFKNPNLFAVDNFWGGEFDPNNESFKYLSDIGVNFFYADQSSVEDWDGIESIVGRQSLDFLIEDGSHWPHHMMYTLYRSIDLMKTGGYYFMEDIQTLNSRGWWGYDNADIGLSLLDMLEGGKLQSEYLDADKLIDIENNLELLELVSDPLNYNYLAVFRKK